MDNQLLSVIYHNGENLVAEVSQLLDESVDPNHITKHSESPLRVASNNGRLDVIKLLLARGADASQLGWSPLFFAIAFGDITNLEEIVTSDVDLEHQDFWERTPFLFSVLVGDIAKTALLLNAGANKSAVGRCGRPALSYAVQKDHVGMLNWLIQQGFDPEQRDYYSNTPLIYAVNKKATQCVKSLINHGVDIFAGNHIGEQAIAEANDPEIVNLLISAGADINDMSREARAEMLGYQTDQPVNVSKENYLKNKNRTFGTNNPTPSNNPFWLAMVQSGASAYQAASQFEKKVSYCNRDPVWCYDRFGKSITALPDGCFIEVAGEHEDHYDPDFCIYNDVFVHDGKGQCQIYSYPRSLFPPTDFHTATLIKDSIYLIGNLGYYEDRKPGFTQVFVLDIHSLEMEPLITSGDQPGWISRHKAVLQDENMILISGGKLIVNIQGKEEYIDNSQDYLLDLSTRRWLKITGQ